MAISLLDHLQSTNEKDEDHACFVCWSSCTPYVIPGPNLFTCVTFSLLNCHVMSLFLFMLSRLLDFTRF